MNTKRKTHDKSPLRPWSSRLRLAEAEDLRFVDSCFSCTTGVRSKSNREKAEGPGTAGSKPKKIIKYLKETTGKRVILRDVHNLVQRLRAKRRDSGSVEDRLEAVLRFPKVLLLDSTHGTNSSKYKMSSLMTDDVFGHNESHACMLDAIDAFKETNPSWDTIRAIMIDKDFSEINL
ncbi:hypothetical protein GQ600_4156 [Phytophthora cactorum]|nr:hypothetical protein GQ600_4156 [Phytophthora cactorum]